MKFLKQFDLLQKEGMETFLHVMGPVLPIARTIVQIFVEQNAGMIVKDVAAGVLMVVLLVVKVDVERNV